MNTRRRAPLDRERVARAALDLLNDVGLEGLTLSAIGRELGVKAPALYWHFRDKQALLDEMATEMYRQMITGSSLDPADTWRERLRKSNHGLRQALRGYRDGARVFSGSRLTGVEHAEQMRNSLRLFTAAGFTPAQAAHAATTAYRYTIGFVIEEQGVEPLPDERREGFDVGERARMTADSPLSADAGAGILAHHDRNYAEGLELVIAGIATRYDVD